MIRIKLATHIAGLATACAAAAYAVSGCGSSSSSSTPPVVKSPGVLPAACGNANLAARFKVEDLGAGVSPVGVNSKGQVIATANVAGKTHGLFISNGTSTDLGGDNIFPVALNNNGQVAGNLGPAEEQAFMWQNGKMTLLKSLPGGSQTIAIDINNSGIIVGQSDYGVKDGSGLLLTHAVVWQNPQSAPTDLGILKAGDVAAMATSINDSGQIVGWSGAILGASEYFMAASPNATVQDLGFVAGGGSASGYNELDTINIGNSGLITLTTFVAGPDSQAELVLVRSGSAPVVVPPLIFASKPDATGQFTAYDSGGDLYFYEAGKGAQSLPSMVPTGCTVTIKAPVLISSSGVMVASGTFNGASRGFLITP